MPYPSLTQPAARPEIRYFFDPLCGWCYGFSPVLMRLYEEFGERADFVAHPGGMIVGERVGPVGGMAAYIQKVLPDLEARTGVEFGEAYKKQLAEGTKVQDSTPPSVGLTALARLDGNPGRTVPFAHALLLANFRDGLDLSDAATLAALAAPFMVDELAFRQLLADEPTLEQTQQGFAAASQIGITGFPTLVYRLGSQGAVLARGYVPYEQAAAAVERALNTA